MAAGKTATILKTFFLTIALFLPTTSFADVTAGDKAYAAGDYATALSEYQKAVDAGDLTGHLGLGKLYGYGHGVVQHYNTAEEHLLKAAAGGLPHAYYILGNFHNDDAAFGFNAEHSARYYVMAAEQNAAAHSMNGELVAGSGQWIPLTDQKGIKQLRAIADLGNVVAQFNTGVRYYLGEGAPRSHKTAKTYLLMAAIDGNAEAQYYLAQNHMAEKPDNFDKVYAYKWLAAAAAGGHKIGNALSMLESSMTAEQITDAKAQVDELFN